MSSSVATRPLRTHVDRLQNPPIEYRVIAALAVVFLLLAAASFLTHGVKFLDVGSETNLWTWANVLVLGYAALALLATGSLRWFRGDRSGPAWLLGAVVVAGFSLDDLVQIHEHTEGIGRELGGGEGLTHFAWLVPGIAIAALCVAALLPAMVVGAPAPRRLMALGTVLMFTGAIGFEAVSGYVLELSVPRAAYVVLMHVEELLEAFGAILFLGAGLCDLRVQKGALVDLLTSSVRQSGDMKIEKERMGTMIDFMKRQPELTSLYAGMAVLTLGFQIWVRSSQCAGIQDCGLSFAKAIVWSVIWPVSWVVYLAGFL